MIQPALMAESAWRLRYNLAMSSWLFYGLVLSIGVFLFWRIRDFSAALEPGALGDTQRVSIIIPARNEARRIPILLESLQAQTSQPYEVIVVDDHSSDQTAVLATAAGCQVVQSAALPENWLGKNWACWQGAQVASGELLVFLDADTRLAPNGLEKLVACWSREKGLLTVQPDHITRQAYEQLSAFFNIVLLAGSNVFTALGERFPAGGGFGPCIVCSRHDYLAAGGHAQVRTNILESIPLVRNFQKAGIAVHGRLGRGAVAFRMYPDGIGQLIEGWSKGFGSGAVMIRPTMTLLISLWITGYFSATVFIVRALSVGDYLQAGLVYVLFVGQFAWILYRIGHWQAWIIFLYPLPLIFFAVVMGWSIVKTFVFRRVTWHGRKIEPHRRDSSR